MAIQAAVLAIPPGRVSTYGWVARAAGLPGHARLVGHVLKTLPSSAGLPWHRVINAAGRISLNPDSPAGRDQRRRLEEEGVVFGDGGRINLGRFGWNFNDAADL